MGNRLENDRCDATFQSGTVVTKRHAKNRWVVIALRRKGYINDMSCNMMTTMIFI